MDQARPLTYRIDPHQRIVTITGDYADEAAWRELLHAVATDDRFSRGSSFIRDLRDSAHPVDAATVIGIIKVVQEYWTRLGVHRAAIVTKRGIDIPALTAHALADSEDIPLRAFDSYDDAVRWVREDRARV